jgi:hypothetical protein
MAKTTTGRDAGQAPGASPTYEYSISSASTDTVFSAGVVSAADLAALMAQASGRKDAERIGAGGIATGTRILTLDGALPVEFLNPGDRIITRSGMKVLRQIRAGLARGAVIRIGQGSLGHDRPEQPLVLAADTPVLLRDWRAQALYGTGQALVPVSRLADGEMIVRIEARVSPPAATYDNRPAPTASELTPQAETQMPVRLYTLQFDTPEILYADGVEVGCEALPVPRTREEEQVLVCPA